MLRKLYCHIKISSKSKSCHRSKASTLRCCDRRFCIQEAHRLRPRSLTTNGQSNSLTQFRTWGCYRTPLLRLNACLRSTKQWFRIVPEMLAVADVPECNVGPGFRNTFPSGTYRTCLAECCVAVGSFLESASMQNYIEVLLFLL